MNLIERHLISRDKKEWKQLDELSFASKNLYNATLYIVRNHFFDTSKLINHGVLYQAVKTAYPSDYYALPTKVSNQVIIQVLHDFKAWFAALKSYKINPTAFTGRPKPPKYKDKSHGRNVLIYELGTFSKPYLREGLVKVTGLDLVLTTTKSNIKQLRITRTTYAYAVEIVYEQRESPFAEQGFVAGLDIGLNNLGALTSNRTGLAPLLINGRPLKSINQFYNKRLAELQQKNVANWKIERLTFKRNNKINDYLHKASLEVVRWCLVNDIGLLVIGKNNQWKTEINIGKRTNQNFVQIPHARFIQMIQYKAQLYGLQVVLTEESYTSKCSFLDLEVVGKHETYAGKRVKRGLFRSATGKTLNADINGSLNIIRKVAPDAFSKGVEAVAVQPRVICL